MKIVGSLLSSGDMAGKNIPDGQWFTAKILDYPHRLFFRWEEHIIGFTESGETTYWALAATFENYRPVDIEIKIL